MLATYFVHDEHGHGDDKRHQIKDNAIRQQGTEQCFHWDRVAQLQHHERFKDAQSARHMANQSTRLCEQKGAEKRGKGEPMCVGEEHVQYERRK